jgi:demethylmenaquinone methyltransferase / 2-methoxy-6-polyprenyl-1,4-benzoquinol methylase
LLDNYLYRIYDIIMNNISPPPHKNSFGFQSVNENDKEDMVQSVFSQVAFRYDIMNDLMSAGLHHGWKESLLDKLRPSATMNLLDVAGGTGDIAFRFLKRGGGLVTISDLNQEMLDVGMKRAIDFNLTADNIKWQCANAEKLPFLDASFDAYTISFGIRNVTHIEQALSEAYRCLKWGGRFLCLEFSMPKNEILRKIYNAYSFNVIPKIGEIITDDKASYEYLVESIRAFPTPKDFADMIKDAGFERVEYHEMTSGIVHIHSGWKI